MMEENTVVIDVKRRRRSHLLITCEDMYRSCHSARRLYCVQWIGGGGLTVRVLSSPAVILPPNKRMKLE